MAIDYERLMARRFPEVEHHYTKKDTILYALGLGLGGDPTDPADLGFLYEEGLRALPTMAVVLAYPGFWAREPDTGIDWVRVVHGEQSLTLHRPLPPEGTVVGRTRITGIVDKGQGRGALIFTERQVRDRATGELLATVGQTIFARGDGGFGGPTGPSPKPHQLPDRPPEAHHDHRTLPQAALIYRLSGDLNPLHADPKVARAAGYDRPILHGLCTFGIAAYSILRSCCGADPARLTAMQARFSAPVFPGETIRTELWREGTAVSFRVRAVERDVVVVNNGLAVLSA